MGFLIKSLGKKFFDRRKLRYCKKWSMICFTELFTKKEYIKIITGVYL
jgi:hypothetical protein